MTKTQLISRYGYKLVTWQEFEAATDKPEGLLKRAKKILPEGYNLKKVYVAYDPCDSDTGFLSLSDSKKIILDNLVNHIKTLYKL